VWAKVPARFLYTVIDGLGYSYWFRPMHSGSRPYKPAKADRKRFEDRAFLARLRTATSDELIQLHLNHSHGEAPLWKKVAIARAIVRVLGTGSDP